MFPEAGGSSSFARHAFNEFWSFFAAWGQMLNYMLTIATSAFFVPHYIGGLFWPALEHLAGRRLRRDRGDRRARAINIRRRRGVARREPGPGRHRLLHPGADRDHRLVLVFSPQTLIDNVHLGVAPTWKDFIIAIPLGHDRLHRDRDDLEHVRGGQGRDEDDPGGDQPRGDRGVRDLRAAAGDRAVGAAGALRRQPLPDAARGIEDTGRLRRRPGARRRQAPPSRAAPARGGDLRRAARRDDPVHRDQRRDHRRLAARPTRWGSTASCPTGCAGCIRTSARRGSGSSCSARSRA